MSLKCILGFHEPEIVLNTRNNKLTTICERCKTVLNEESGDFCCTSCLVKDTILRINLKKCGKAFDTYTLI